MKQYLNALLIGLLLIGSTSCSDYLQKDPPGSPSEAIFWKEKAHFDNALTACFSTAYDWPGVMSQILPCYDNLTDNSYCQHNEGTYGGTQTMAQGEISPTSGGLPDQVYGLMYKGIGRVNQILFQLDKYKGADISADQRKFYIAQCKALRGYYYHYLYLCYKEVPLVTELLSTETMVQPKAARSAIQKQVFDDFDAAIADMTDAKYFDKAGMGYFTKDAVKGLRARVMIYDAYGENGIADPAKMADVVTLLDGISGYTLSPNFRSNFITSGQKVNSEIMYSVRYLAPNITNNTDLFYAGWGTNMVTRDLVNEFEYLDGTPWGGNTPLKIPVDEKILSIKPDNGDAAGIAEFAKLFVNRDIRLFETIYHSNILAFSEDGFTTPVDNPSSPTNFAIKKLIAPCTQATKPSYESINDPDVVIIRYGHVLLMIAEAENEANGPTTKAYNAINKVRQRVGQPDLPAGLSQAEFRARVRKEWRVETAFEAGIRYFQMKQWNLMDKLNTYRDQVYKFNTVWKPEFRYWPLPQGEIDKANGVLVQDPSYK